MSPYLRLKPLYCPSVLINVYQNRSDNYQRPKTKTKSGAYPKQLNNWLLRVGLAKIFY